MTEHPILGWTPAVIVFDCDGTLMDSERHWQAARDLVLRGHGIVPDAQFAEETKGVHYTECGVLMAQYADRPHLAPEMTDQLLDAFRKLVAADPVPTPGAVRLVRSAARFAPLAVASNCPYDVVESCLDAVGLLEEFTHIVVPGPRVRPKPEPDVYRAAVGRHLAAPEECLAVEDSLCGLTSAARAGLRVLGVGPQPSPQAAALAQLWVPTLAEPSLVDWADSRVPQEFAS